MAKLICLANSWRPGGRCIAGIDVDTGEWIRPVLKNRMSIPEEMTIFGKHQLEPLDVLEVELSPPNMKTRFQKENRLVVPKNWKLVGKVAVDEILKYCSDGNTILHGFSKVVDPDELDELPPDQWDSLELKRISKVTFELDSNKKNRWKALFCCGEDFPHEYKLSLTDPIATARLNNDEKLSGEWVVTFSLTEPMAMPQFNLPELCYKLAVALIQI